MAGLQMTGLASGLDTASIIDALMAVERQPRTRLANQQSQVTAHQAALRDVATQLKSLRSAADNLGSIGLWADTQTVESSDTSKVVVSRTGGAGPGGYQIAVQRLASSEQRTFAYTSQPIDSTITVGGVSIAIAANSTIDDVVATINSTANSPVYAVNAGGNLVMSSRTTGAAGSFSASGSAIAEDTTKAKAGLDAQFTIDGVAHTSSSNVVTDPANGIPGLSITLRAVTSSPVTVNVGNPGPDKAAVIGAVKSFVTAYNNAVTTIRAKLNEQRVPNPQSSSDITKGVLFSDDGLGDTLDQMRNVVSAVTSTFPAGFQSLAHLGITTGAPSGAGTYSQDSVDGKLVLDESKLSAALDANPQAVQQLLGGTVGVNGFKQAFEAVLDPSTRAGGILDLRISGDDDKLKDLADSLADMDDRLSQKQSYYQNQFTQLELALQQLQSQQQDFASKLGGLTSSS